MITHELKIITSKNYYTNLFKKIITSKMITAKLTRITYGTKLISQNDNKNYDDKYVNE
jgi:hypothetical protein